MNRKCILQGHLYKEVLSITPMDILESLIEDDFCYDMALDKEVSKQVHWLADYYRREYGSATISNYICIRCGSKENCIELMKEEMGKQLSAFLYRPSEKIEPEVA